MSLKEKDTPQEHQANEESRQRKLQELKVRVKSAQEMTTLRRDPITDELLSILAELLPLIR